MKKRNVLLKIILVLSVLGLLVSLYLVQNHYAPAAEGSFCDFTESVSCSLVNTSVYSMLLGVPVAIFGALWFVVLFFMALKSMKKDLSQLLLGWNLLGLLFIIYFVIAEIILQAICPFCTVVHIIVLITLVLSIILFKEKKRKQKFSFKKFLKTAKPWIIGIAIINLIPLILLNIPIGEQEDHTELAKCLTEKGVNMYGSFRCGICAKTREMFGDSFKHVNEIECHPQGENSEWELCQEKGISGTPTWILEPNGEEQDRYTGFLDTDELKEFAGCQ